MMETKWILSILVGAWLFFCAEKTNLKREKVVVKDGSEVIKRNHLKMALGTDFGNYIHTDTTYTTSSGKGITIQNSFPKGGMIEPGVKQYVDPTGKKYGFAVFWTRVINETSDPLALHINVPKDLFAIFTVPDAYARLLLPSQKVTLDKLSTFNYGLTDLQAYLDANLGKTSLLRTTIEPNQEHLFHMAALTYKVGGTVRAGLVLKEQDLYYKLGVVPYGSGTIPIGKIDFKTASDH
ncbi:hypothetical protein [Maribacter sp. 2307ULW6-5]|uniref:hypothetical protein n=1 Tax=Maribacter sp. 2307ULW6-5 TaxID=3386275 RepID=UPI0039BCEFF8